MSHLFFYILILFFVFDFFILSKKKIFNYFQLTFIILSLIINLYFAINSLLEFNQKIEFIILSIVFTCSSYFAYLNILAFINRSGTFLILIAYYQKKQKKINIDEIFKLKKRINELKKKRLISVQNKRYVLTKKGKIFIRLYLLIINIFRIKVIG